MKTIYSYAAMYTLRTDDTIQLRSEADWRKWGHWQVAPDDWWSDVRVNEACFQTTN